LSFFTNSWPWSIPSEALNKRELGMPPAWFSATHLSLLGWDPQMSLKRGHEHLILCFILPGVRYSSSDVLQETVIPFSQPKRLSFRTLTFRRLCVGLVDHRATLGDLHGSGSHRHESISPGIRRELDGVPGWQECRVPFNEFWVSLEERDNPLDRFSNVRTVE